VGYKGPITVVPNGVDPDNFVNMSCPSEAETRWPQLSRHRVVLFLSRISREKGLEQLLSAWGNLTSKPSYGDAVLVIAGPDYRGYLPEVEAMIEKFHLESNVILTGLVQGQEKSALISRADIYALPSHSEGFSMSLLENLAASKPVLVTPGCNFPEITEVGAGLCVPPTSNLLEQALMELLDMPDSERRIMGQRGRELVMRNYTWEVAARKMITVYQCILDGRTIPMHPKPAKT
jgi:glycosyltransferase involved in cell wall biosynthesis